ncbi:rhodanese-like domain-containing protein [Vibrio rumoiensis]|uniref:Rhodanese-like domain-containing protein n=1 Tax=Vibrio rumoiensis 1S-45 TaxID=1188252 RepID=A0A1E5DZ93_9VIBR|nr:rhodanese-like domain-containing protein [Vibrio rumoiensis]OEF22728.1 rhodanese-like domain-containing protein [Vibrio rumoiensis 1S-45]
MQEYTEFFQNNMILVLVWVGVFAALIGSIFKSSTAKYKIIGVSELTQQINREDGVVIDIRTKDEYKRGHISGAVHILPTEIKSGSIATIEKYKTTPIIVVCKTGQTVHENANALSKAGFEKVSILKNGMTAWNDKNLPLVSEKSVSKKGKK